MENEFKRIFCIILLIVLLCPHSMAYPDVDDHVSDTGIELDKIITLGSSLLATALFIISFLAYRRPHGT